MIDAQDAAPGDPAPEDAEAAGSGMRPMTERQAARRRTILSVTLSMIAEQGYAAVTMERLAAASGVSKKTLYDIHGGKDALLAAAVSGRMRDVMARIEARAEGCGLPRLLLVIRLTIRAVLETPQLSRALQPILLRDPGRFTIRAFFDRLHRQCLRDMVADGALADWADDDFLIRNMMVEQIGIQNFWAADIIRSEQLEAFSLLSACRILLPPAQGPMHDALVAEVRRCQAQLAAWDYGCGSLAADRCGD